MSATTPDLERRPGLPVAGAVGVPTALARHAATAAVVLLVATLLVGLVAAPAAVPTVVAGRLASGTLEARTGADWRPLAVGDLIPRDVELRTATGAVVGLGGGAVELAAGAVGVRVVDHLDLVSGSALVESEDAAVHVTSGLVEIDGLGTWRVDAGVPGRVGVYDGAATLVDAGGREEVLARGQQVALGLGRVVQGIVPLRYVASDGFDARLLGDALAVDAFLAATGRGLEADYGLAPQTSAFYTDFDGLDGQLVTALRPLGFEEVGDRFGPPATVLTAAVVTEALVTAAGLDPLTAAAEVDAARRAGAEYGLVTHLRDVSPSAVRAAAGRALSQRRDLVASGDAAPVIGVAAPVTGPGGPPVVAPTAPPTDDPTPTPTATPPDGGPSPRPTPPPSEPEPEPEPTESDPGPTSGLVDDVEEVTGPLEDVVGDDVAELLDETTELVDELLSPLPLP